MAGPVIGQVIAQGYNTGRAIGNDFSQMRFARKERQLREALDEEARAAGKASFDEYIAALPVEQQAQKQAQIEQQLRSIYQSSGAAKRRLTEGDMALDDAAILKFQAESQRGANRGAALQLRQGDYAGGYGALGDAAARFGNAEGALSGRGLEQSARLGAQALRSDGTFNAAGYTQGMAGESARMGKGAEAQQGFEQARQLRLQFGQRVGGQLLSMARMNSENPGTFTTEQMAGALNALASNIGEFGSGYGAQLDGTGAVWLTRQDQAIGSAPLIDANGTMDRGALAQLEQFTQDADGTIKGMMDLYRATDIKEREANEAVTGKARDAMFDVLKGLPAEIGKVLNDENLTAKVDAIAKQGGASIEQTEDGKVINFGGRFYQIKVNPDIQLDPKTAQPIGKPFVIVDQQGQVVKDFEAPPTVQQILKLQTDAATTVMRTKIDAVMRASGAALQGINALSSRTGGQGYSVGGALGYTPSDQPAPTGGDVDAAGNPETYDLELPDGQLVRLQRGASDQDKASAIADALQRGRVTEAAAPTAAAAPAEQGKRRAGDVLAAIGKGAPTRISSMTPEEGKANSAQVKQLQAEYDQLAQQNAFGVPSKQVLQRMRDLQTKIGELRGRAVNARPKPAVPAPAPTRAVPLRDVW